MKEVSSRLEKKDMRYPKRTSATGRDGLANHDRGGAGIAFPSAIQLSL